MPPRKRRRRRDLAVAGLKRFARGGAFAHRLALCTALLLSAALAQSVGADELLAARHKAAGLACAGCHGEATPHAPGATAVCLNCHGSYAAIAAKTATSDPNPHASHKGELPCESCHHAHKPSVDYCAQCHDWGFKVP